MSSTSLKGRGKLPADRYINPDDDPRGPYIQCDLTAPGTHLLRFEWHGQFPPKGRRWRFNRERMDRLEAEGRIAWSRHSALPRFKRYLAETSPQQRDEAAPALYGPNYCEFLLRKTMRKLAECIARFPGELRTLEWPELERVLREVFEGLGFATRHTPLAKDGGFDLELSCLKDGQPITFLVEIKHWTPPSRPGRRILKSFFEVVVKNSATTGLLLSSSGFSSNAIAGRTEVERQRVRLGDHNKIVTLCQHYVQRETGLWIETTPLPDLLFGDTI